MTLIQWREYLMLLALPARYRELCALIHREQTRE